ncbi:pleiotrophin [Parasteatoda tepidariorum]|uniref:pleiotrophin n=1 Tax=Parasteatoda tepidariorum TaxID=114398 RepID=UPI00077F9D14|nr:pleiotrophin [Parasteatoda tepidariorum]XP_015920375.1 pleiotrophin [Parasteatoda tepidariorum]
MERVVLNFIILSSCLILKTYQSEEFHHSTEDEVIFRVTRGVHSHDNECRYKKSSWSECDSSNLQRKTLNLKRGDSTCEQTKVVTRHCKKTCKYEKGEWSECETNSKVRTDTLKPKSDSSCQPTRTLTKKCKKACKYNKQAAWSECDFATGKKSKVLNLKNGSPQVCEAQKKITRSCQKAS